MTKREAKKIIKSKKLFEGDFDLFYTEYKDNKFSIESTNIENVFYITKSFDEGLSYEFYKTVIV